MKILQGIGQERYQSRAAWLQTIFVLNVCVEHISLRTVLISTVVYMKLSKLRLHRDKLTCSRLIPTVTTVSHLDPFIN